MKRHVSIYLLKSLLKKISKRSFKMNSDLFHDICQLYLKINHKKSEQDPTTDPDPLYISMLGTIVDHFHKYPTEESVLK